MGGRHARFERRDWGVRLSIPKASISLTWHDIDALKEFIDSGDEYSPGHPLAARNNAAN
jgi:hypothetical protein